MSYLEGMNEAQRQGMRRCKLDHSTTLLIPKEAVTHDPSIPLQILAGPGSGRTVPLLSYYFLLILTRFQERQEF